MIRVTRIQYDGMIHIKAPHNPEFSAAARSAGGDFDPERNAWVFHEATDDAVSEICNRIYGEDGLHPPQLVNIDVTITSPLTGEQDNIYIAGRPVVTGTGSDDTARIDQMVILIEGKISCGGTEEEWHTRIQEGTILRIMDVPMKKAASMLEDPPDGMDVKIVRHSQEMKKRYLGDGVYANHDGQQILLETSDGYRVTNRIFLNSSTLDAFDQFRKQLQEKN